MQRASSSLCVLGAGWLAVAGVVVQAASAVSGQQAAHLCGWSAATLASSCCAQASRLDWKAEKPVGVGWIARTFE
jgi:hypothetical protein